MKSVLFCYLLLTIVVCANYYDSDIDGVEDRFDQCSDTPFDDLVDKFGCSENSKNGKLIFTLGSDIGFDTVNTRDTTYNFSIDYKVNNWVMGLSNSNYIGYDENNITSNETGDIYTYIGYELSRETFSAILALGTKIATAKSTVGTGENDYYFRTHFETHSPNNLTKVFSIVSYTITGDTSVTKYEDIFSYTLGIGYSIMDSYYTSIYYENSESLYQNTEKFHTIVWSNHYRWNENSFIELDYAHGLDSLSYAHMISFKVGVTFE